MKKNQLFSILTAFVIIALIITGCAPKQEPVAPPADDVPQTEDPLVEEAPEEPEASGDLVLYTSAPQEYLDLLIEGYEKATGVKVELVTAGTGELLKKIETEGDNPLGDILLGGTTDTNYNPNLHLFEEYVSVNDSKLPETYQNKTGKVTSIGLVPSVIIVNKDLKGDVVIEGYEDLLNPAINGQIAFADPSKASSSFEHLVNMLYAMGGGNTDEGWAFVEALVANLDDKLLQSSSAVPKGVADGEYTVGLTYESAASTYIANGAPMEAVYMSEGVVIKVDGIAIIKNAKNLENAKKFIDYIIGEEFQGALGSDPIYRRTVRTDVPGLEGLPQVSELNVITDDPAYVIEHKQELLDKFLDIVTQ